jgi:hypothetical protein
MSRLYKAETRQSANMGDLYASHDVQARLDETKYACGESPLLGLSTPGNME